MLRTKKPGVFTNGTTITVPARRAGSSSRARRVAASMGGYSAAWMPALTARGGPAARPRTTNAGISQGGSSPGTRTIPLATSPGAGSRWATPALLTAAPRPPAQTRPARSGRPSSSSCPPPSRGSVSWIGPGQCRSRAGSRPGRAPSRRGIPARLPTSLRRRRNTGARGTPVLTSIRPREKRAIASTAGSRSSPVVAGPDAPEVLYADAGQLGNIRPLPDPPVPGPPRAQPARALVDGDVDPGDGEAWPGPDRRPTHRCSLTAIPSGPAARARSAGRAPTPGLPRAGDGEPLGAHGPRPPPVTARRPEAEAAGAARPAGHPPAASEGGAGPTERRPTRARPRGGGAHPIHAPPSTLRVWPVHHPARSEAKKSTAQAMSSGLPRRPRGMLLSSAACPSAP